MKLKNVLSRVLVADLLSNSAQGQQQQQENLQKQRLLGKIDQMVGHLSN